MIGIRFAVDYSKPGYYDKYYDNICPKKTFATEKADIVVNCPFFTDCPVDTEAGLQQCLCISLDLGLWVIEKGPS